MHAIQPKWLIWRVRCIPVKVHLDEAFKNATSAPYAYLLIDLKQETDDKLRLRTGIFRGDVQYVYLRK